MKKHRQLYLTLILGFILGIHRGNIALWKNGQTEPAHVFPYRADTLPRDVQEALTDGILVDTPDQLAELAENYFS